MSVTTHHNAMALDIPIVEAPFLWKAFASKGEIGSKDNTEQIKLVRGLIGIPFTVELGGQLSILDAISEARGRES